MLYISVENEGEFLKITIPRLSTSNAITFCRTLQECQRDDTYFFDVSGVNNYEPLPMLLTAASIRQFCEQRDLGPWDIQLLYSENKNYDADNIIDTEYDCTAAGKEENNAAKN